MPAFAALRELLPREHALWGWVGVPLFAVLCAVPCRASLAVALCTLAGVGAWNALGRWLRGSARSRAPTLAAGAVATLLAAAAIGLAQRPFVSAFALIAAGAGALLVAAATRGKVHQNPSTEAGGIALLCVFAWLAGVGAGGDPRGLGLILGAVLTWLWLGLWWINRSLAPLLPNRVLWRRGPLVVGVAIVVGVLAAAAFGPVAMGLLPLLYLGRIASTGTVSSARDARRVGLAELAWGLALAAVASHLS